VEGKRRNDEWWEGQIKEMRKLNRRGRPFAFLGATLTGCGQLRPARISNVSRTWINKNFHIFPSSHT
jgi:hypothetical protein